VLDDGFSVGLIFDELRQRDGLAQKAAFVGSDMQDKAGVRVAVGHGW